MFQTALGKASKRYVQPNQTITKLCGHLKKRHLSWKI